MPVPLSPTAARWRATLAGQAPVTGMWVASGIPVVAEICAGSGVDWLLNRVTGYLTDAAQTVSLLVQAESRAGLAALPAIAGVDGIDGIFLGPADLAERYLAAGARFILAGADVTLLAAGSEELARRHRPAGEGR